MGKTGAWNFIIKKSKRRYCSLPGDKDQTAHAWKLLVIHDDTRILSAVERLRLQLSFPLP